MSIARVALFAIALVAVGCAPATPTVRNMVEIAPPRPLMAPADQAIVVVPPGRHMFIVWAENTDAIDAELAPGL